MLQTDQSSDPESIKATAKKDSITSSITEADTMTPKDTESDDKNGPSKTAAAKAFEWEEVKKARNRINSQRIRERERAQIANLEAERARLWLSNDAIQFQNRHFREVIAKILQVRETKRNRAAMTGNMRGAPGPSSALAASLGGLGAGSSMLGMRQDMMGGLAGGLDTSGLFQNARLTGAASKGLSGLSDADLLARHQATSLEVQSMMRQQQEAMDRFGAAGGMGGLGLNNGMANNMNNGINMNAASPYADIAENIRIRQLMLQQSAGAPGDGILSNPLVNGGGNGNNNSNGLSLGQGALGDLGNGMGDVDIFQMSKRQKFGL